MLFSTEIALGCNPNTGDTISLTEGQVAQIGRVFATEPDPQVVDTLAESLAAFPLIAALRRDLSSSNRKSD